MALGKIQHLYNILYIADACVLGKQLWLPILCHLNFLQLYNSYHIKYEIEALLIIECTEAVWRVP